MSILTAAQIYGYAVRAGFSPDQAVTFTAIALAESGGETNANAEGTEDSQGLWQINVSPGVRTNHWGNLYDPAINARAAFEVSNNGTNIQPWSVTHESHIGTGAYYKTRMAEAQAGAAEYARTGGASMMAADVAATDAPSDGPMGQPITDGVLTDTWGAARIGHTHEGIDIFAEEGTPIHSVIGGRVAPGFTSTLGGNVVRIDGDDGRRYYYAHVKDGSITVQEGQRVEAGQVIAGVGDTGNAKGTSPHLHFGIYVDGDAVNPYDFLVGVPNFGEAASTDFEIDTGAEPIEPVDTDGDALTDAFEDLLHTDKTVADSDKDSLSDYDETTKYHTDPMDSDTDDDKVFDKDEVTADTDPGQARIPTEALQAGFGGGRTLHSDSDGLSDLYEIQHGTDPFLADSDGDFLNDDLELAMGENPNSIDSNNDGMVDFSANTAPLEPTNIAGIGGPNLGNALAGDICPTCGAVDCVVCPGGLGGFDGPTSADDELVDDDTGMLADSDTFS